MSSAVSAAEGGFTRPRLAEHVVARQHVRGSEVFVLLYDERRGTVDRIDRRTWLILSVADGTRDAEGIRLAAKRLGAHATSASILALIETLAQRKMILDGPPLHEPDRVSLRCDPETVAHRPLERLDFRLHCDESGTCCRQYETIVFTPEDAARARAWVPRRAAGPVPAERLLLPLRGSAPVPLQAITLCDGACAHLDADGRCEIHRVGGLRAKPVGCSVFPMRYCDDGMRVRQGIRFECGCVFESIANAENGPDVLSGPLREAGLPEATAIDVLPERIEIVPGRVASRASLRAWTDALLQRREPEDVAMDLWSLAEELESSGSLPARPTADPCRVSPEEPAQWVEALHRRTSARLRCEISWRLPGDPVLEALRWVVATTSIVRRSGVWAEVMALEPSVPRHELFYRRATAFGYAWVDGRPLVTSLRDRAIRLWIARAMPALAAVMASEASARHPLATLEMLVRGHGLRGYGDDV
jgi:lysine-N-methylase